MSRVQEFAVRALLDSDLLYWIALNTVPRQLVKHLLATDPELLDAAGAEERRRAEGILEQLMPISARSRGMLNDARLAGSPAGMDFGAISVPTLVVSVEDDRFGTATTARDIAASIRNARLVVYPSGGHIWIGHDDDVADEIEVFLAKLARR